MVGFIHSTRSHWPYPPCTSCTSDNYIVFFVAKNLLRRTRSARRTNECRSARGSTHQPPKPPYFLPRQISQRERCGPRAKNETRRAKCRTTGGVSRHNLMRDTRRQQTQSRLPLAQGHESLASQSQPLLIRYLPQQLGVEGTGVFRPLLPGLLGNIPEKAVSP